MTPSHFVRKMSALTQPPCPCGHTIHFEKSVFFAEKVRMTMKNSLLLVRKISALDTPLSLDNSGRFYGQPPYHLLFVFRSNKTSFKR